MEYIKVLDNLKHSINHKGETEIFKKSLEQLKTNFGQEVSTKFLRNLSSSFEFRKKRNRISYLLRMNGLKTKRKLRFYKEWTMNKYKTDVTEYAVNKKGRVYIKNICSQEVGRDFVGRFKEVCFIIKI